LGGFWLTTLPFAGRKPLAEAAESTELESDVEDYPSDAISVAVLTRATDVVWTQPANSPGVGSALSPGWLRFSAGAVQIEFSRGARIVLEGPAEINLISNNEAFLQAGRLRANVPEPAHGFKILSPEFTLVDHGTEFGCVVSPQAQSEVHVFTGEVEVHAAESKETQRSLRHAEAVRVNPQQLTNIVARPDLFLTEEGLSRRQTERTIASMERWRTASKALAQMPGALIHVDFNQESEWSRSLLNQAQPNQLGSIVGASWTEGRWPGKGALEFKSVGDRVRLQVPGKYESLTFMTWARIDALPHKQHALIMGESFQPGEVHWYVYKDGSLGLGVRVGDNASQNDGQWRTYHSRPCITAEKLGQWAFLVTVFDGETGRITHFYNGEMVGTSKSGIHVPLHLAACEIGNWGVDVNSAMWKNTGGGSARRSFRGAIDEFTVISQPLYEQEIHRLYEAGHPGDLKAD
jgi:Concanavalin A-like lectin/glucanases superfamily/FecR protein